jgi:hypothetical protein
MHTCALSGGFGLDQLLYGTDRHKGSSLMFSMIIA